MTDEQDPTPPQGGNAPGPPQIPPRPNPLPSPIPPRPQQPAQPAQPAQPSPFVQPQVPVRGRGYYRGGNNHRNRGNWGRQRGRGRGRNPQGQGRQDQGQNMQHPGQQDGQVKQEDLGQQGVQGQAPPTPAQPQATYGQYAGGLGQMQAQNTAAPYADQWQPPPLTYYPPSPYSVLPPHGLPPTTYQSPQPAWWSNPFATPHWVQQAPAPPPAPAMTPFSRRGHSYRVQKSNNSMTVKSKHNQRAADYQKRKGDEVAKKLEEVEGELKAAKEEKGEALKMEQMREFIRAELTKPQAELQAKIDKWAAKIARKEKEEGEEKPAAEEVIKKEKEE